MSMSCDGELISEKMADAICTLCSSEESPGFYTGCMINDGCCPSNYFCDGNGKLTLKPTETRIFNADGWHLHKK